nr:MAG TPA: hypothetical protein [Caudoviricetes sp.]
MKIATEQSSKSPHNRTSGSCNHSVIRAFCFVHMIYPSPTDAY